MDDGCDIFNEHDIVSAEEELKHNIGNASCLEENTGNTSSEKPMFAFHNLSFEDTIEVPNITSKSKRIEPENGKCNKRVRNSSETNDHVIAERKRRENLTRLFIALSAIIPGLKKMDKLSILNNTIDRVKYLQNRIKVLEEENQKRRMESMTTLANKKPNVNVSDNFFGISNGLDRPSKTFPTVQVSISTKDVIIKVICDKRNGIVRKLLATLAIHNLSVVCSNVLPFGSYALNISIIAKVDRQFIMTMDDYLLKNLKEDLLKCCILQQ
uniref:Transcription factor bHLH25 n=2 Tax=Cajanus cajan TaxID=3821 RepID=A0A151R0T5_CAJCA|nr:Transcription factor bHLH25 [Cajanus cajan]